MHSSSVGEMEVGVPSKALSLHTMSHCSGFSDSTMNRSNFPRTSCHEGPQPERAPDGVQSYRPHSKGGIPGGFPFQFPPPRLR